jgi:hypothetical protein
VRLVVQENLVPGDAGLVARGTLARELGFDGLELRDSGTARGEELAAARAAGIATPTVCPEVSAFIGDFDANRRAAALDRLLGAWIDEFDASRPLALRAWLRRGAGDPGAWDDLRRAWAAAGDQARHLVRREWPRLERLLAEMRTERRDASPR